MSDLEFEPSLQPAGSDVVTPENLGEIFAGHHDRLVRFAGRVGVETFAEDVVQEVGYKLARRVDDTSLRPLYVGGMATYMTEAVRRQVIDAHRARQSRGGDHYSLDDMPGSLPATPDFADAVLDGQLFSLARSVLSPAHAEVIALNFVHGYTVPEIAEELGIPLGTAKSRIYCALRALRNAGENGVFEGYEPE